MRNERPRKEVDPRRISKLLSLILRHRPDEFGLNMDEYGYIPLEEVVEAVQQRYAEVTEDDVRNLVDDSNPKRFEIVEEFIRALYGHSFYLEIDDDPIDPPEKLFMGTTAKASRKMPEQGLRPGDRSYLHLSLSREVAESRSHHVGEPCVVEIDAKRAFEDGGIEFYARGEVVLAREVPAEFVCEVSGLDSASESDDGEEKERPPRDRSPRDRRPRRPSQRSATTSKISAPSAEVAEFGRRPRRETGRR